MSLVLNSPLVSVSWLSEHLAEPDLVVLDASWFMPGAERNGEKEWQAKRIPGARYFDFDQKIAQPDSPWPHMLPSETLFAFQVAELGISNSSTVIVYDSQGIFSAPRVWWMLRAMGHSAVAVLDGGLPAWEDAGEAIETDEPTLPQQGAFTAELQAQWVIDGDELQSLLGDHHTQVFDARPAARFYGLQPEPRVGVRSGHMPQAKSLPFCQLLSDGCFLPVAQIKQRFDALSEPQQQLIFSCGSGVTACILALAAELSGRDKLTVYDGSWTEWGSTYRYPVVS